MQDFGFGDLGWVLVALGVAAFLMSGGPGAILRGMRAFGVWFFNRYIMLPVSPADDHPQSQTSPIASGPPQKDQAKSDWSIDFDDVLTWVAEHNLTDEQAIDLFTVARRAVGDYFLSANKIREGVGGGRDEVLARVASRRPKPKAAPTLRRPANGW